jgi:hypothetical protein
LKKFHFNFNGKYYNAKATIKNNNGKISCDISGIFDNKSEREVTFIGFESGPLVQSEVPVIKAISRGLKQYLENYAIDL